MRTHLKEREYYEDLYDSFTVDTCRFMRFSDKDIPDEEFLGQDLSEDQIKALKDIKSGWIDVAREIGTFCYAAERYKDKSETIDEWIKKDREKDERLAKLEPPRHVRCRECLSTNLRLESKEEYWGNHINTQERLLCMYICVECETRSAFFDNGEAFKVKETRCPECQANKPSHVTKVAKHKYTITYTCSSCSHIWKEVMDFTPDPPKPADPNYIEDRKLYCYSDKLLNYVETTRRIVPLRKELGIHDDKPQETLDPHKAEIDAIVRLTIGQVMDRLKPVLTKQGYNDFQLGQPEMGKQVVVPFNVIEGNDRNDDESRSSLYKLISKQLDDSNWRLVRSSLTYRMGYLTGKLKGYESNDDLRALVEKKARK